MKINEEWLNDNDFSKAECVELSVFAAELVRPIWEAEFPNSPEPRNGIDAAKAWLADPTEENRWAAYASADAAAWAAGSTCAAWAAAAAAYGFVLDAIYYAIGADPDVEKAIIDKAKEILERRNKYEEWLKENEFSKAECVELAVFAAEEVLPACEVNSHGIPDSRRVIDAAKCWLYDPTEKNRRAVAVAWNEVCDVEYTDHAAAYAAAYAAAFVGVGYIAVARSIRLAIEADPDVEQAIEDKANEILERRTP